MPKQLSVRIDDQTDEQLTVYERANGYTRSQAAREILKQALTTAEPRTRGWDEGRLEAFAMAREAINEALERVFRER